MKTLDQKLAKLPPNWTYLRGGGGKDNEGMPWGIIDLSIGPHILRTSDGGMKVFNTYKDLHIFIWDRFHNFQKGK